MRFSNSTGPLANTPTVVKNLVIINALVFGVQMLFNNQLMGYRMDQLLGLHYIGSPLFKPWQFVTYMFMHGSIGHILGNMFGVFFLGSPLEYRWGSKRFLQFYMICGIGAAVLNMGISHWEYTKWAAMVDPMALEQLKIHGIEGLESYMSEHPDNSPIDAWQHLFGSLYSPMVGASGAVFGILVAFALLYPNVELFIFFIPFPIKAKYFAAGYATIELFLGFANLQGDNIAHFAHIGGLIVGFITVMIWRRRLPHT